MISNSCACASVQGSRHSAVRTCLVIITGVKAVGTNLSTNFSTIATKLN